MAFNVFQQVNFLSMASNLVTDLDGTQADLQKELQLRLNLALFLVPGWKVVWGPVVWKNEPEDTSYGPDDAWYVAFNPSLEFEDGSVHPAYIIAIAGTPLKAEYVWVNQNFGVNAVTDFNVWVAGGIQNAPVVVPAARIVPGTPYIARGTVNAVHLVLTTPAPEGAKGAGTTLLDFISDVDWSGNDRLIATGHSLGGALSPSLALALVTSGIVAADRTLTYPVAAPSPGNQGFTNLFAATFPARKADDAGSYQGWNLNLVNTLDIVPQAWCQLFDRSPKQNLANIPSIYGRPVLPIILGGTIVFAFFALSSGAVFFPLPSQFFTGPPPPFAPPTDLDQFLKNFVAEHILPYFNEVGVEPPDTSEVLGSGLSLKTEVERRFDYPVIAEFEWAREHPEEAQKEIEKVENTDEGKAFRANV